MRRATPSEPRRWHSGFTLIEIIGALLIFSVGLMMVIQLSTSMGVQMEHAAIRSELVLLARERLDSLETVDASSLEEGTVIDTVEVRGRSYIRSVTIAEYSPLVLQLSLALDPTSPEGPTYSSTSYVARSW